MFTRLFIGNLSFQATAEDVRELFQHAGTVGAVRIITDQFTGRSRGVGFVEMATGRSRGGHQDVERTPLPRPRSGRG